MDSTVLIRKNLKVSEFTQALSVHDLAVQGNGRLEITKIMKTVAQPPTPAVARGGKVAVAELHRQ
jgi:hypothetical protein